MVATSNGDTYELHSLINIVVTTSDRVSANSLLVSIGVATALLKHFQIAKTTFTRPCMLNISFSMYRKDTLLATSNGDNYVLYSIINIKVAALFGVTAYHLSW